MQGWSVRAPVGHVLLLHACSGSDDLVAAPSLDRQRPSKSSNPDLANRRALTIAATRLVAG
jgi:hypothetical protein